MLPPDWRFIREGVSVKATERAKDRNRAENLIEELHAYARKQDVHLGLPTTLEGDMALMCEIVYRYTDPIGEQAEANTEAGMLAWLVEHGWPEAAVAWKKR